MSKGPYLTPRIKTLIANIYLEDRQIGTTKARELLLKRMKTEGLDKIFGSDFPRAGTISKELKALRERDEARTPESKELDEPWDVASLTKYNIPAEALPIVMRVWLKSIEFWEPLTIRESLWVSRLYHMVKKLDEEVQVAMLWLAAQSYSRAEMLKEVLKGINVFTDRGMLLIIGWISDSRWYSRWTDNKEPEKVMLKALKRHNPELLKIILEGDKEWEGEGPGPVPDMNNQEYQAYLRQIAQKGGKSR